MTPAIYTVEDFERLFTFYDRLVSQEGDNDILNITPDMVITDNR